MSAAQAGADHSATALEFVKKFYLALSKSEPQNSMDDGYNALRQLYREDSLLSTIDPNQPTFKGSAAIVNKYKSLGGLTFQMTDGHVQLATGGHSLLVVVSGKVQMDAEHLLHFVQVFNLVNDAKGDVYIANDFFNVIYG